MESMGSKLGPRAPSVPHLSFHLLSSFLFKAAHELAEESCWTAFSLCSSSLLSTIVLNSGLNKVRRVQR